MISISNIITTSILFTAIVLAATCCGAQDGSQTPLKLTSQIDSENSIFDSESARTKLEQRILDIKRELQNLPSLDQESEPLTIGADESATDTQSLKRKLAMSHARIDAKIAELRQELEQELRDKELAAKRMDDATTEQKRRDLLQSVGENKVGPGLPDTASDGTDEAKNPTEIRMSGLVTAEVVHQQKLADSLFSIGDTENALRFYKQIVIDEALPADAHWIRYQIASCHRRLRNYEEAEKLFRELANEAQDTLPIKSARWWLAAIEKRKNIEHDIALVGQIVTQIKEESSEDKK